MLCVGWNQKVGADIHAGARAFFERDDGQAIQEMIQYLFALHRRFFRDAVSYLRRGCEHTPVVSDLGESAQAANSGGGGKRLQVSVVHLRCKSGGPDLVETDVLGKLQRKSIGADGAMKGDEHLALLGIADTLHISKQPGSLRKEKLLVIVGVEVSRE